MFRILNKCNQEPRIAPTPSHDADGIVAKHKEALTAFWVQHFAKEFAGNIVGVSLDQAHTLLCDRRAQPLERSAHAPKTSYQGAEGMPVTVEEWVDALQPRLAKTTKGKHVGLDDIPNALYIASGNPGQLLLAQLLHCATSEGSPMTWKGGQMWAAPRKPLLPLSPFNSRALLCSEHKSKPCAAAVRRALAPTLQLLVKDNQSGAVKALPQQSGNTQMFSNSIVR